MIPPPTGGNLDEARALLDTAGWTLLPNTTIRQREGVPLAGELFVRGDDERRVVAARYIAETASNIGIAITVQAVDFTNEIIPRYAPPFAFDLLLGSWLNGVGDAGFGDYVYYDPDDFALFHSSQVNQGLNDARLTRNVVGFSDPAYDDAAQSARQLYRIEERKIPLLVAQTRIASELPYLYLWVDRMPVALSDQLSTLDGAVNIGSPQYLWNIERWYVRR